MNLKGFPPIHSPEKLVEIAFRRASKEARKIQIKNRRLRRKRAEERRVKEASHYICSYLARLEKLNEKIEETTPFNAELIEVTIGREKISKALAKLRWARKNITKLEAKSRRDIRMSRGDAVVLRKDFYGKTSSILKKIKGNLEFIGNAAREVKNFPTIKEEFTIVIAGMPNVGKSSILKRITTSKPEIKPYPFTTKSILVGYLRNGHRSLQIVDTPGILDRSIEERNPIERQAILALKDLADVILFIFDPSETCGFTMESQMELYAEIKRDFKKVFPIINKIDIVDESLIELIEKRIGEEALKISATEGQLKEFLMFVNQLLKKRG
jgi:nucleolar GTP-binding protein